LEVAKPASTDVYSSEPAINNHSSALSNSGSCFEYRSASVSLNYILEAVLM